MKKRKEIDLDFEIDKLTNSIENAISGEVFDASIIQIDNYKQVKKNEWAFNWQLEIKDRSKTVYKLTTTSNPDIIHGLISLADKGDHIFMDLIENAGFNKGKKKLYKGVAGNLVAFLVKPLLKTVMVELSHLLPRPNSLNITHRPWGQ